MNKKTIAAIAAIATLTFGLSACGNGQQAQTPANGTGTSQQQKTEQPKPQPADLTGTWKMTNGTDGQSAFTATVTADTIEIQYDTNDMKALYWKGTYTAPTAAGDFKWTSKGDTEAMSVSLLASQDASKDFTYTDSDKTLSFEYTIQGVTKTVKMNKQ